MTVFLGHQGFVQLRRDSLNRPIVGTLKPDDVNVSKKRFSFDFDENGLISGDQVDIARTDKDANGNFKDLELCSGHYGVTKRAFVHVDNVGGVRLYGSFDDAVCDKQSAAISLIVPTENQSIEVSTRNSVARCVAQMTAYEVTTNRETVDITSIGEEFRRSYANGLISGQGSMECLWDYKCAICDDGVTDVSEFPQYLAQLVIRTQQGADFDGFFYLDHSVDNRYVWYEAKCVVTNVAMNVEPTQLIRTRVQFVTTGEIRLKIGIPPAYVLQEDNDLILLESEVGGLVIEGE